MRGQHRENATAIIAELARASGLQFARPDRLTRAEAERVIAWAQGSKEVMAAYTSRAHPHHQEVLAFSAWPFYFAYDHPQDEAGDPLDWGQVRTAEDDAEEDAAAAAQPQPDDPFTGWGPERARERIEAAMQDGKFQEWRDAYGKPSHPDHELAKRELARLHEIAYPEEPAEEPSGDGGSQAGQAAPADAGSGGGAAIGRRGAGMDQAAAHRRIDELYRHPAYADHLHPEHHAIVAETAAAFAVAYPEPATDGSADAGAAA